MEALIKITEQDGNRLVSARELHQFLESKQQFTDWIKNRIEKYGFIKDVDFTLHKFMNGKNWQHDYILTLDTSKEIAMVEGNDKGKQARRYFIEAEKQLRSKALDFSNPDTVLQLARNWKVEQERRILTEKEAERLRPKAELMDKVMDTEELIDIGQVAKVLGLPFGRNTLFKKLREKGVFFKNRNEPKQEYVNRHLFELKEKFITRNNHEGFMVMKVLVTQKDLAFIAKLFEAETEPKKLAKVC